MTNANIITGHEVEIAEIERQKASPEFRALIIKKSGEALAGYGETLRLAALGQLTAAPENVFGECQSVADQVADAEVFIARHVDILVVVMGAEYGAILSKRNFVSCLNILGMDEKGNNI